jgi:hypothetical protein
MKTTNQSKKECYRPPRRERKERARRKKAMNGRSRFVSVDCTCVAMSKCWKVNREVTSALKQYFIMPGASLICRSSAPVSTYLTLHNLAKCIMLLTHVELVPYPGIFIQNVQSWDEGIFIPFLEQSDIFLRKFLVTSCTFIRYWWSLLFAGPRNTLCPHSACIVARCCQYNPLEIDLLAYAREMWFHYTLNSEEYQYWLRYDHLF